MAEAGAQVALVMTTARGVDLLGIGEAMVLLQPPDTLTLDSAAQFDVRVAGAELNACAAVARLGGRSAFLTRLGDDPLGAQVRHAAVRLGVEMVSETEPHYPTGLFLRDRHQSDVRQVFYYRAQSAATRLGATDAARARAVNARAILVSGLTAALGVGPRALLKNLAANRGRAMLVIDANLRPALGDLGESIETVLELCRTADILILGADEGELIFGVGEPQDIAQAALAAGVKEVVVKVGPDGCHWLDQSGRTHHMPTYASAVVDTVGAGDAFTGGYAYSRLIGAGAEKAALVGSRLAAGVLAAVGDTEGLPTTAEAELMLRS